MRQQRTPWGAACMARGPMQAACVVVLAIGTATAQPERPICQLAEALVGSVGHHLADWDDQIAIGLNETLNCSMFLEFTYLSRERIKMELDYIRGNFSQEEEQFKAQAEESASTTWAISHMSTAASLVSAHLHIHGVLAAARPFCLSENLQLLFLMSLRRMKTLLQSQLRQLWVVFQGTAELFRQGAGRWLAEMAELFTADLRTMESIMVSWQDPELRPEPNATADGEAATAPATRPGPPLPPFGPREDDGVALSTLEVLRRDTFEEWNVQKPALRALLRHVLPRDGHVADVCAGSGQAAAFLNDTGLLYAYGFDPSPNVKLLSKGSVDLLRIHAEPVQLWRTFDMVLCLSAATDFAGAGPDGWAKIWQNIDALATKGAVLSCGTGETRSAILQVAEEHAPSLRFDEAMSLKLDGAAGGEDVACVFWRAAAS